MMSASVLSVRRQPPVYRWLVDYGRQAHGRDVMCHVLTSVRMCDDGFGRTIVDDLIIEQPCQVEGRLGDEEVTVMLNNIKRLGASTSTIQRGDSTYPGAPQRLYRSQGTPASLRNIHDVGGALAGPDLLRNRLDGDVLPQTCRSGRRTLDLVGWLEAT